MHIATGSTPSAKFHGGELFFVFKADKRSIFQKIVLWLMKKCGLLVDSVPSVEFVPLVEIKVLIGVDSNGKLVGTF